MPDSSTETAERFLTLNQAKCLGCGDVITSRHRHDFVTCSCGALSVDGGLAYARRSFKEGVGFEDLCTYSDTPPEPRGRHQLENSTAHIIGVHAPGSCYSTRCTIHSLSDHSMRSFEQVWDDGVMWRRCSHTVLHPDPDESLADVLAATHECCESTCCSGAYTFQHPALAPA